jgi:hypothetical protein
MVSPRLCRGICNFCQYPDTTELEQLVEESNIPEGSFIFTDKGYASERIEVY